jgi:WD40 repeat protein
VFNLNPRLHWRGEMSDYVSAIAASPDGHWIAIADAGGQVCRIELGTLKISELQGNSGQSIDCLEFSPDGQFLAAAGQAGTVMLWRMQPEIELITTLEYPRAWIDCLVWHPTELKLVFQAGFDLYIVNLANIGGTGVKAPSIGGLGADKIVQLPIGATAQAIQWHPQGHLLAIAANDRLIALPDGKWDQESVIPLAAPATTIGWSQDGRYLALGNLECHLFMWEWGNPDPWRMQGFPGKVSQIAWSDDDQLVMSSLEGVVRWERSGDDWQNQIGLEHQDKVMAIAFSPSLSSPSLSSPGSSLLASGGQDGRLILWRDGRMAGRLKGFGSGIASLAWSSLGDYLIVGGVNGELRIWEIGNDS